MRSRRLFGIDLASDFPFATLLSEGEGPPEVSFAVHLQAPEPTVWQRSHPIYTSPFQTEEGESVSRLYRTPGFAVLEFPGHLDFYLRPGRIDCHLLAPRYSSLVEIRLLGPVLAYWLESRGIPALHASAVTIGKQAVAFLSTHGAGKTGLAAAFMRAGGELLTDDLLPVEEQDGAFLGRPGYPQMRMWPDEAAHFLEAFEHLPLVLPELAKRRVPVGPDGFGVFCTDSRPLTCLYLPERLANRDAPVELREVSPRDAVIELIRHSFSPHLVEAVGLQPARLDLFARLVRQVPVRRLLYPSGFERLPEVVEAVRRDLPKI
jgi:hypothetical protein